MKAVNEAGQLVHIFDPAKQCRVQFIRGCQNAQRGGL